MENGNIGTLIRKFGNKDIIKKGKRMENIKVGMRVVS